MEDEDGRRGHVELRLHRCCPDLPGADQRRRLGQADLGNLVGVGRAYNLCPDSFLPVPGRYCPVRGLR